ncbi:hypothetical protein [Rheinheimera baltica]|uniref:hypothetical protein n=1 Tax=Rheinheimera baltica TaxID=67576 RepID=UPI0004057ADE|nr:hypothetical protein [Rheinheimera baltica]
MTTFLLNNGFMRLIYLIYLLLFTVIGCKPQQNMHSPALVLVNDTELVLQLDPGNAPVETPLLLKLSVVDVEKVTGELTGVSMYMGRVPLTFSKTNEGWQAEFLLGACSDPKMVWQLSLELSYTDEKKRSIKQQFQSSWR